MRHFWGRGAMFVRELQALYPEPKPHFNTLSTQVRTLENAGFLTHEAYGNSFRYQPAISEVEYGKTSLSGVVRHYFGNSYLEAVSSLVSERKITVEELRELIGQIERGNQAERKK